MSEPVLVELKNVAVSYGRKQVLRDVSLTVRERDFLGIIGPNGGGKTTLVKTILGLLPVTEGTLTFYSEGKPVQGISIGYLPQYNQIDKKFPITVYDVILSGLKKKWWKSYSKADHEAVHSMLKRMGVENMADRPIGALSGGQIQRVLLGRAIISRPEMVILDEPNTYMDKQFESQLYYILEEINKECAVVLVSHDIGAVLQNVRSIACVNETLDYHPDTELPDGWLEEKLNCPIDLVGHGNMPHRVLKCHKHR